MRTADPVETQTPAYVADCRWRTPFQVSKLPLAARLYRYRKGAGPSGGILRRALRLATPSRLFLKVLFASAGHGTRGEFVYARGSQRHNVQFRFTNTQFRALYFPEYAGGYEPETTCLIDKVLAAEPDGTFYDIGANWGFYSLHAASLAGYRGRIHAFEPQPDTFGDLRQTVDQAGLSGLVTCHAAALSDQNGSGFMELPDGLSSGLATLSSSSTGTPTKLVSLDSLDGEPPSLIKVDVEGAEAAVFLGGRQTLARHQPMIVFESWLNAKQPDEALHPLRVLRGLGYRFFQPSFRPDTTTKSIQRTLVLTEFQIEQRPLLAEHFNVFACHAARCEPWLSENFSSSNLSRQRAA